MPDEAIPWFEAWWVWPAACGVGLLIGILFGRWTKPTQRFGSVTKQLKRIADTLEVKR